MRRVTKASGYTCGKRSSFDGIRPREIHSCAVSGILEGVKNTTSVYNIKHN
jgi:hypothetical protein